MEKINFEEDAREICRLAIHKSRLDDFDAAVQLVHDYLIDITGNYRDRIKILEQQLADRQEN